MILPEVGASGQLRIEQGSLLLPSDLSDEATEIARRYARAAGLAGPETPAPKDSTVEPLLSVFRHSRSRHMAHGALTALSCIHRSLTEGLS